MKVIRYLIKPISHNIQTHNRRLTLHEIDYISLYKGGDEKHPLTDLERDLQVLAAPDAHALVIHAQLEEPGPRDGVQPAGHCGGSVQGGGSHSQLVS